MVTIFEIHWVELEQDNFYLVLFSLEERSISCIVQLTKFVL